MTNYAPLTFSIGRGDYEIDPRFHEFANFLGLKTRDAKGTNLKYDTRTLDKLKEVYKWAVVMSGSEEPDNVKTKVYELQRKVGVNWVGETLIGKLWQSVQLDSKYRNKVEKLSEKKEKKIREEPAEDLRSKVGKQEPIKEVKPERREEDKPLEVIERPRGQLKKEPLEI